MRQLETPSYRHDKMPFKIASWMRPTAWFFDSTPLDHGSPASPASYASENDCMLHPEMPPPAWPRLPKSTKKQPPFASTPGNPLPSRNGVISYKKVKPMTHTHTHMVYIVMCVLYFQPLCCTVFFLVCCWVRLASLLYRAVLGPLCYSFLMLRLESLFHRTVLCPPSGAVQRPNFVRISSCCYI